MNKQRELQAALISSFLCLRSGPFVFASGLVPNIPMPPPDRIQSADGHVQIGVSPLYGGAISYLKDDRIPDSTPANGNIVDYSQAGGLLSTALWTLPINPQELTYCEPYRRVNGTCPALPIAFNNPTQGGTLGWGIAGNPHPTTVALVT